MQYNLIELLFIAVTTVLGISTVSLTKGMVQNAPVRETFFSFIQPDNLFSFLVPLFEVLKDENVSLWLAYGINIVVFFHVYLMFRLAILVAQINMVTKGPVFARQIINYQALAAIITAIAVFDGYYCVFLLSSFFQLPEIFSSLKNIAGAVSFLIILSIFWVEYLRDALNSYQLLKAKGYIARLEREIAQNPDIKDN